MFRRSDDAEHSSEDGNMVYGELACSNDSLYENSKIKEILSFQHGDLSTSNDNQAGSNNYKEEPSLRHENLSVNSSLADSNNTEKEDCLFRIHKTFNRATEDTNGEDSPPLHIKLLACNDNLLYLSYNNSKDNSRKPSGTFRSPPKSALRFPAETDPLSEHSEPVDCNYGLFDNGRKKKSIAVTRKRTANNADELSDRNTKVVSFRVKRTLPGTSKFSSKGSNQEDLIEEPVEMQQLQTTEESTFEVLPVEMAAYPTDENPLERDEDDGLMDWWRTVEGWSEWNGTTNFPENKEELAVEAAADRVFMAARLFVSLFNQRGASLQHRIVELLTLADTADSFHKKTVSAAVGGGVASVAGGIATITGLILAPFTFGTSTIVTAVGISVATAGSITSATANITDAVQSKMDRKKVEKMIQCYQNEISDIRDCLEFMQEGMNTLQEWNFKEYSESVVKTSLNRNLKHVMKEGGRAGKALMINTDRLIGTVKVLGVAGGAAKAAKAISVTTGVMSTLFLALDVFFLAKDSNELRKGAKTKFASKIREVCRELQNGLLELNEVKTQLQKTMDGIEVEEYEEHCDEEESDPIKLAQLEQELEQLEEKLDQKTTQEQKSNITRNGCGINKLCMENPTGCDPSGSSQCFFTSSRFSSTNKSLAFELSGNSTGYIALATGVNSSLSQGTNVVFVCGNNNGSFFFQTTTLINNSLAISSWLNVSNIQGSIRKSLIQCAFNIPIDVNIINTLTGINTTNFNNTNLANTPINAFVEIFQGSTSGTVLGQPKSAFGSSFLVNLANASSVVVNTAPTTTTTTTTTITTTTNTTNTTAKSVVTVANGSISLISLLSQAAITLLSIFTLCLL
ncbi:uncharacterized protein LOC127442046 isoform X2 [Myxocyprinus asiaticus]|nr:uncharacterized protein LOC127442046 isoform X2 [Myxocyprinus asiaticus]XP_051555677.1 uncharacterized protein LOC127442046 isoform X2 [Myxocyprinus asiaticus]